MKEYKKTLTKIGLALVSFLVLTYFTTWKFAILALMMIGIHEHGHLWAMRWYGLKTGGFYFIPFVGGVATPAENQFLSSRWSECIVALMGPLWGFGVALVWAGVYWMTNDPMWAYAAFWGAMMNLFNLLPIIPLDGGWIMKSTAHSIHPLLFKIYASLNMGLWIGIFFFIPHPIWLFVAWLVYREIKQEAYLNYLEVELPKLIEVDKNLLSDLGEPPSTSNFYSKAIEEVKEEVKKDIEKHSKILDGVNKRLGMIKLNFQEFTLVFLAYMVLAAVLLGLGLVLYEVPGWDAGMAELLGSAVK